MMKNFKHFTKRTLALLLALVMCVGLLQLTAFAEDGDAPAEPVTGDSAGLEETESEDGDIMPLAEEDETEGGTVLVKWLKNHYNTDPDVYYSEPADLGENGEPTNQYKYDEGENVPGKRNGQVFMGWYAAEKETVYNSETKEFDETGNWIIRAHWEVDQWADPLVPVGDRPNEWGDGIPDQFQIHVLYYMLNGSFTFDGKAGVRSGGTPGNRGGKAAFGVAASTTVTKRDSEGRPASNGTARFAAEHIPTNVVPDSGYTSIKWYVKDTQEYVDAPVVGAAVPEPESAIYGFGYVIACRSRQNVTVKYIDTGTHISTETYYKGSYFQPLLTDGIAATGQTSIKIWKNESTNTNYYLPITNSYVYTITENMNLTAVYQTGTGISTGVDVKTVSYDWGGIVPSGVTLPGKMNFKGDASVKVQPGPTGSVRVGNDEYVFLGWKVTSGSIQNQPANSDYVGSSIKLNRENVVLTAQWVKKQPPAVLVIWKSGGEDNVTLKAENVPAEKITEENGKVTKVDAVYPDTPTRDGYSFNGWTIEKQPDGSIVITAQWTTCNHDWRQTTPPTCEGKGEETCSKCGETREIPATGHAYPDEWTVTKPATCEGKGEKVKVCGNDKNHVLKEDIEPIGHDWEIKDEGDAGHSWVCKNDPEHTKPVEPHNYPDEWTVTKQPTDTEPGEKEKVCEDCGHKHTEEIPATKPDDPKPEKVNVTYQDPDGEEIGKDTPDKGTEYEVKGLPDGVTPPEGKEFDKWTDENGNEYKPGDKITPDGDLTLTVVWKDKPEEKPEEPETPVPVVPEIVVTPKPSEDPTPSEDPGEEIIDPSEPPLGELPSEPPLGELPTEPSEAPEPSEPAETDPAESEDLSEEIIDPSEPPLSELPEDLAKPGEPADTDQPGDSFAPGEEPGEDISDGQPPMGNVPEEPGEDISDNRPPMSDAPVSDVPQTGEASNVIWLAATLLAGAGLVVVNTGKRKEERK